MHATTSPRLVNVRIDLFGDHQIALGRCHIPSTSCEAAGNLMDVFSKSKILAYLQCRKRLWLEVHQPELGAVSKATTASFPAGQAVFDVARQIYDPDGNGIFMDIKALGVKGLIAAKQFRTSGFGVRLIAASVYDVGA